MAPSATTWMLPNSGGNGAVVETVAEPNTETAAGTAPEVKLFKDIYSKAFTDGYISGYSQPQPAKQIPIAITGFAVRLPGNVATPDELWELCSRSRTGWSEIPKERFDAASFYHPNPGKGGCFNAKGGNFLKEDLGLRLRRWILNNEYCWSARSKPWKVQVSPNTKLLGKMLVYLWEDLSQNTSHSHLWIQRAFQCINRPVRCAFAMQSNRISHFFDLRGPSFTMDTACSSSLVALHQACQSLRNGECKMAIVGGCHLNMLPEFFVSMSKSRLFSDEGRSFSFDARGTGYGRGEGCGIIVLKPLEPALKDNDIVRAVIRGSGVNQDGKTPGIAMPNGSAQESLMKSVYERAGVDPKETGYVEAHGTGTKVGDPIEAAALYNVFGEGRTARNPLFVGSVKSNIGHLEAASGIISVIKAAMMLERGFILPNYDFKAPNPKIPFTKWHLKVPISQRPFPRDKRFVSINNFGFGGTNAHVILERAPFLTVEPEVDKSALHIRKLFVLSANYKPALETLMQNIGIYLERRPEIFQNDLMSNVAYTLGQRRSLMQWRLAISATSSFELIEALNSGKISLVREIQSPRIGFVFTGQGAQWNSMGRELYRRYPVFAHSMDECDRCLSSFAELNKDETSSCINEAHISQPACTAIQLALTDLLKAWNVLPTAVAGHSSGEIGAAYAAGILPLDACMAIAYYRGLATVELRKQFPDLKGSMMAVGCSKDEIEPLLASLTAKEARVACYNSPTSLTISGDEPAIDELQKLMEDRQIFNRKLQVDVAYHSHHMNLVAKNYRKCLQSITLPSCTQVKFHSSLLGHLVDGSRLEFQYWVENLTQSVRFSEAMTSMCASSEEHKTGVNMIVEIGPHSALAGPIKQILKSCGKDAMKIPYMSALLRKKDAVETVVDLAASLFTRGVNLDLGAVNITSPRNPPSLLIDMPRYPWNHTRKYWHEPRFMRKHKNRPLARHDLLGSLANYSNHLEPTWRNILRIDDIPWLRHHQIQLLTLFPMSAFIGLAVEAAHQKATWSGFQYDKFELHDVTVSTPLMLTEEEVEITLQLRPHSEDISSSSISCDEFIVHSWAASKGWSEHCKGFISLKTKGIHTENTFDNVKSKINTIRDVATTAVEKSKFYASLANLGVSYGSSFQGMNDCQACEHSSTAHVVVPDTRLDMPKEHQTEMVLHPALLEQIIELYWPILGVGRSFDTVYLPSSIGQLTISREIANISASPGSSLEVFCEGRFPSLHPRPTKVSMFAINGDNKADPVIVLNDLTISPIVEMEVESENDSHRELCFKLDWEPMFEPSTEVCLNGESKVKDTPSSAPIEKSTDSKYPDIVILHGSSFSQRQLASTLNTTMEKLTGKVAETGILGEIDANDKISIFIMELETPLLSSLSSDQFMALQKTILSSRGVLWVVQGAYSHASHPDANMVTGLSRSIRSETTLKFATLDLDPESSVSEKESAQAITRVLERVFGPNSGTNCELEFAQREGKFFTPRIINDSEMNEYVQKQTKASALEPTLFSQN
ncbi:Beta-ketoacyl synthase domain-containing protein [Rutstroemia sp. NJR-2017a WRK4]|nr:Beta-ketoacyl synthase domain-containing protein [Rutstroemia sp. NJR-2017a WRK4]